MDDDFEQWRATAAAQSTHPGECVLCYVHRMVSADGGGIFGAVRLPPGDYRANDCPFHVTAGEVARVTLPCHAAAAEVSSQ